MEKFYVRKVHGNGSVYGEIKFGGKVFEPTTPHGFIGIGDLVVVRRITDFRIGVRKVLGSCRTVRELGGEETWEA